MGIDSKHTPAVVLESGGEGGDGDEEDEDTIHTRLDNISLTKVSPASPASPATTTTTDVSVPGAATTTTTTPSDLEEEADQQGAFNPETGEINWDCPCLGGMAHGPCGEEFQSAFSCFVHSTADPKGVDCIEKFKGMQDCFRKVGPPPSSQSTVDCGLLTCMGDGSTRNIMVRNWSQKRRRMR